MTKKKNNTNDDSTEYKWKMKSDYQNEVNKGFESHNYYYNSYCNEKTKEPLFNLTDRGHKFVNAIVAMGIGIIIAIPVFCIVSTYSTIKNIEKVLDKRAEAVHNVSSTTNKNK